MSSSFIEQPDQSGCAVSISESYHWDSRLSVVNLRYGRSACQQESLWITDLNGFQYLRHGFHLDLEGCGLSKSAKIQAGFCIVQALMYVPDNFWKHIRRFALSLSLANSLMSPWATSSWCCSSVVEAFYTLTLCDSTLTPSGCTKRAQVWHLATPQKEVKCDRNNTKKYLANAAMMLEHKLDTHHHQFPSSDRR